MDERDSHCPWLLSSEPIAKGTDNRQGKNTLLNLTLVTRDCEGATEVKSKWETSVTVQHHYSHRNSLLTSKQNECTMKARKRAVRPVISRRWSDEAASLRRDGHSRNGSLTGAVHLSQNNAGIPCWAHCEQKFRAERKSKRPVDRNLQCKQQLRKQGLRSFRVGTSKGPSAGVRCIER